MRAIAFILVLLASTAFAGGTLGPPNGYVLAVRNGRLIRLPVVAEPSTARTLWWEFAGSSAPRIQLEPDGGLSVFLHADVLGSQSPYFLDVRLRQWPGGWIDVECELVSSTCWAAGQAISVGSYGEAAGMYLLSGDTLGEVLARCADGWPPQDVDELSARLRTNTVDVTSDTRSLIDQLQDGDWRVRERAARRLSDQWRLPQLRQALLSEELTNESRKTIECLLAPPPAGHALMFAVKGGPP